MQEKNGDYNAIRELLAPGETVGIEVREHRLGGGRLLAPATAFATDQRIIIIRSDVLGFNRSVKMLRYEHITEVKIERGITFCRLHFSLVGEQAEDSESLKWITGIHYSDALALIQFVNSMQHTKLKTVKESEESSTRKAVAQGLPLR